MCFTEKYDPRKVHFKFYQVLKGKDIFFPALFYAGHKKEIHEIQIVKESLLIPLSHGLGMVENAKLLRQPSVFAILFLRLPYTSQLRQSSSLDTVRKALEIVTL